MIAVVALFALAIYLAQGRRRRLLGATGASLVFVGLVIASLGASWATRSSTRSSKRK